MADCGDRKTLRQAPRPFRRLAAGLFAASGSILLLLFAASRFEWGENGPEGPGIEEFERAGQHQIENPRYVAKSGNGRSFLIVADWATPADPVGERFRLRNVVARSRLLGVDEVRIGAASGIYDTKRGIVELSGGVELRDGSGQRIGAGAITIDAGTMTLRSDSEVRVRMSEAEIVAGSMLVERGNGDWRGTFGGGVRATYAPAEAKLAP